MLASWHNVSLSFPDKVILEDVSFTVNRGERIGLVGENGTGKTCLFRILLGELRPHRGEVFRAAGLRVGYLQQEFIDTLSDKIGRTSLDIAMEPFSELVAIEQTIDALNRKLTHPSSENQFGADLARLGELQQQFERLDGYTFRARTEAALRGLGLSEEAWQRPIAALSAGQKVRVAVARLVLSEYDLLLLDEPTNHLDVEARAWLEERLQSMPTAMIVVSHDRRFLDSVVAKVAHLDRGRLSTYPGDYSAFAAQRRHQTDYEWQQYEKRQKQMRRLEEQAQAYRNWSNAKEGQKRGAHDKGYIGRKSAKLMKRSLIAQRRLDETVERMKTDKPFEKDAITIDFRVGEGRKHLVAVRDLAIGFEPANPLATGIRFALGIGDRLALSGPNGCGKTTLLRTILGRHAALDGDVVLAPAARIGYFDQENRELPLKETALAAVLETGHEETVVRTVMGRMRIRRESVHKELGQLSAGERAKALLARLILGEHNVMILDEPTNHLDIETQDTLLDALAEYPGAILFVSHDRHFQEMLATQVLEM